MRTTYSKDGTPLAYERSGDGPAVVLIGGAFSDRSTAAALGELLASAFTVYCYDRRGRGDSGDTLPYAVEREVEDLAAILAEIGGPAHAYGHSSGAVLALEGAARGLPLRRLAVYEPPYIVDDTRAPLPTDLSDHVANLLERDERSAAVRLFLLEAVGVPPPAVDHLERVGWPALEALVPTVLYDLALCGKDCALPAERFAAISVPVCALSGGASPTWATNAVRELSAVLPHATHRMLEGQDHGPDPAVLAPALEEFFSLGGGKTSC